MCACNQKSDRILADKLRANMLERNELLSKLHERGFAVFVTMDGESSSLRSLRQATLVSIEKTEKIPL